MDGPSCRKRREARSAARSVLVDPESAASSKARAFRARSSRSSVRARRERSLRVYPFAEIRRAVSVELTIETLALSRARLRDPALVLERVHALQAQRLPCAEQLAHGFGRQRVHLAHAVREPQDL